MRQPTVRSTDPPGDGLPHLLAVFARAEFKAPVDAIVGLVTLLVEDSRSQAGLAADVDRLYLAARKLEAIVSDLLDPARAEQQLNEQDPEAFSSLLRHELRTPITSLLGYGELMIEDAGAEPAPHLGILSDIIDAARQMLGQIDAMVAFIRVARGSLETADEASIERHPDLAEPIAAIRSVLTEPTVLRPKTVGRILVVDDNGSTLDLLTRQLAREGHEVTAEGSAEAALARLETGAFDLALLDLLMPGLSGIEILRDLKGRPETANIPVIIISALDEVGSTVRCIEAGADDYLTKPINPVLLRARVEAALERKVLRDRDRAITEQLRAEQARAEALLRNVLPGSIVARLRAGESVIADRFAEVTILFSDLVDFTATTARMAPDAVLDLLNRIFSGFDRLAADHGLEKIKTIGDAYMLAGGLPVPRPDHAAAVADMALSMPALVEAVSRERGHPMQIRIGLHSGPVAAGIIGKDKFIYDVWGDTVNVASRMEHYGEPGRVHISAATRAALGPSYAAEARQPIDVKGRGLMSTFFLTGGSSPRAA